MKVLLCTTVFSSRRSCLLHLLDLIHVVWNYIADGRYFRERENGFVAKASSVTLAKWLSLCLHGLAVKWSEMLGGTLLLLWWGSYMYLRWTEWELGDVGSVPSSAAGCLSNLEQAVPFPHPLSSSPINVQNFCVLSHSLLYSIRPNRHQYGPVGTVVKQLFSGIKWTSA